MGAVVASAVIAKQRRSRRTAFAGKTMIGMTVGTEIIATETGVSGIVFSEAP
jgi:hypothetical protein